MHKRGWYEWLFQVELTGIYYYYYYYYYLQVGEIEDVRLIMNYKGKSKGYAYVQFKDEVKVSVLLTCFCTHDTKAVYVL